MDRVVPFTMKPVGLHIDVSKLFVVILRPTGYLRRSNRHVTAKPLAVVVPAMSPTTVSSYLKGHRV